MDGFEPPASSEALRARIVRRHAVRLHCALILVACFATGLLVTKLMLMAGVSTYPQAQTLPDVLWHLRHAPS